jgi:putative endopeptidase
MRLSARAAFALAPIAVVSACGGEAPPPVGPTVASSASAPPIASQAPAGPIVPSIDEAALDKNVAPCDDFYQFACGSWIRANPVPDDEVAWGRSFSAIHEKNQQLLKAILEKDAAGNGGDDAYAKPLGDYYAACMDEDGLEKRGTADLHGELEALEKISSLTGLMAEIAHLHTLGVGAMFDFDSQIDAKDATQVIGGMSQGGLGLPDRDYYIDPEPPKGAPKKGDKGAAAPEPAKKTHKQEIREFYAGHVERMFALAGAKPVKAKANATTVMRIETLLARASMTNVELRDPKKTYHRLDRSGLKTLAPRLDWDGYFAGLGVATLQAINVAQPDFAKALNDLATSVPLADWKVYLRWHLLHRAAASLPSRFVQEDFGYQQKLRGAKTLAPRWKRCVRSADGALGEALAQPFVKRTLGPEGKANTLGMVQAIEAAMGDNLSHLSWMDDATRAKAIEKLGKIRNKIAYPDAWRNYDALKVDRASYWGNRVAATQFEVKRQLAKIGKPVDHNEWEMTPPTVNAYYEPTLNEIVFPAGILQPPFYGNAQTRGTNFGGIGMVIGHEITHGFDDEGRQYDAMGNLSDWWSPKVSADFDQRAACVAEQFDGYVAVADAHVNGKLTLGENIADLGGLKISYAAFEKQVHDSPPTASYAYTEDQQFFLGFAQSWCETMRPEMLHTLVATNPHSPPNFRVDGPLSNLPTFAAAFSCKAGDRMVRANACEIW